LYENCFGTRNENSHKKKERTKKILVSYKKKFEHDSHILSRQRGYIHTPNSKQLFTRKYPNKTSNMNFVCMGLKKAPASPYILATYWGL
jgi:predicted rRNA methylase YqxC with S4 and FtsJ domains